MRVTCYDRWSAMYFKGELKEIITSVEKAVEEEWTYGELYQVLYTPIGFSSFGNEGKKVPKNLSVRATLDDGEILYVIDCD